jgi:two-component system, chemotaxis family, CheB/CheR fusion protein
MNEPNALREFEQFSTFFRDPDTFDYLRQLVIPALLTSKPGNNIRVWSAGCASGEECYSIAMLLAEALGTGSYLERVKIYATDVDEEELALARRAVYPERRLENVPPDLRARYFDRDGAQWAFKKDFRRTVIFGRHDLLDDAPISKVDLLVCRNTLMYFSEDAQAKILSRFRLALREGGYLVLGHAERPAGLERGFTAVSDEQRVFAKTAEGGAAGTAGDGPREDLLREIDQLRRELQEARETIRSLQTR